MIVLPALRAQSTIKLEMPVETGMAKSKSKNARLPQKLVELED
jgi:hypothetical protein